MNESERKWERECESEGRWVKMSMRNEWAMESEWILIESEKVIRKEWENRVKHVKMSVKAKNVMSEFENDW